MTDPVAATDSVPPAWQAKWYQWRGLPALTAWAVGMLMAHHPTLLSGFRRMQWDLGDTRFLVYILEHGYRWLMRWPHHERFWDAPIYYPQPNVAAFSETLITSGPIYWVWRWLAFEFDTAFQLWTLSTSTLNFVAAYLLLRRCMAFASGASAAGAFFFAFAAARINQLGHEQLLGQFFVLFALYSLSRVLTPPDRQSVMWQRAHIIIFFVCMVAQLYAGFYSGWFFGLALGFAAIVALALRAPRRLVLAALRRNWWMVPIAAVLGVLLLIPFFDHYGGAAAQVGYRDFGEVSSMQPHWGSWLDMGPYSWLYWRAAQSEFVRTLPIEWEQRIGLGVLTPAVAVAGLVIERRRPLVQVMAIVTVMLLLVSVAFPNGMTAWRLVYDYLPAAKAIRAVCRIGLLALIPVSVGLAIVASRVSFSRRGILIAAVIGICGAEQGITTPAFDKVLLRGQLRRAAAAIEKDCDAFLLSPRGNSLPPWKYHLDGMWLELITRVPTLNGYSGSAPVGWPFAEPRILLPGDELRLRQGLEAWTQLHHWTPKKLCLSAVHVDDGVDGGRFVKQVVPKEMIAGKIYRVEVTFENIGTSAWTPPMNFRLGSADGSEPSVWGVNRIDIPKYVDQHTSVTFLFDVRAPQVPGPYRFQWRMVHEGVSWFGESSDPVTIEIEPELASTPRR